MSVSVNAKGSAVDVREVVDAEAALQDGDARELRV